MKIKYNLFSKNFYYKNNLYKINRDKILFLKKQIIDYYEVRQFEEGRLDLIIKKIYGSVNPYKELIVTIFAIDEFSIKESDKIPLLSKETLDNI